jgi:surface protein
MAQTFTLTVSGLPVGGADVGPIPIAVSSPGTVSVNWGDSTIDTLLTHPYTSSGPFTITITTTGGSTFTSFGANVPWGQEYLTGIDSSLPSTITSLQYAFSDATAFNQDISTWDTVAVTDMMGTFLNATTFNQNLGGWNVSNITNAVNMLDNTALSISNYNALLNGWAAQSVKPTVVLTASGVYYGAAGVAGRNTLTTAPNNWTIKDAGLPCFVTGTRILTPTGYVAVECLKTGDQVLTADGRSVPIKHYIFHVFNATAQTAPYRIAAGALGIDLPTKDIFVSGSHSIKDSRGIWQNPSRMAKSNPLIKQYGLGEDITYYHIECPNYYTDDLVSEGVTVESYTTLKGPLYKYNTEICGYIRIVPTA